jgi:hypothetical protein
MKATKLQKRAAKAISRAEVNTRNRKVEHVVVQNGESFHVIPATDRFTTAHAVAKALGGDLIYSATR